MIFRLKQIVNKELCPFSLMIKLNLIICIVFIEGIVPSILRTKNMQLFIRDTKRKITPNPNGVLFSDDILYIDLKLILC